MIYLLETSPSVTKIFYLVQIEVVDAIFEGIVICWCKCTTLHDGRTTMREGHWTHPIRGCDRNKHRCWISRQIFHGTPGEQPASPALSRCWQSLMKETSLGAAISLNPPLLNSIPETEIAGGLKRDWILTCRNWLTGNLRKSLPKICETICSACESRKKTQVRQMVWDTSTRQIRSAGWMRPTFLRTNVSAPIYGC